MFILYGTTKKKIKTFTDQKTTCDLCGGFSKEYRIYQPCFHIFWIPFFPIGRKYMVVKCSGCNAQYDTINDPYLSNTRTPFFMFLGPLLILGFIIFGYFSSKAEQRRYESYINSPGIGDVYLMKTESESGSNLYYFSKIIDIKPDSISMLVGAYDYSRSVSKMDTADYFITDFFYTFHKSALKDWWDEGNEKSIERKDTD